jgi:hypothetical protein
MRRSPPRSAMRPSPTSCGDCLPSRAPTHRSTWMPTFGQRVAMVRIVRSLAVLRRRTTQRWSSGWEAQALLRARPVAGSPDLQDCIRRHSSTLCATPSVASADARPNGDAPAQGQDGGRAATARRRPGTAPQTRSRGPVRRRVGRPSCSRLQCMARRSPQLRTTADADGVWTTRQRLDLISAAGLRRGSWMRGPWRRRIRNAIMLSSGKASDSVPDRLPHSGPRGPSAALPAVGSTVPCSRTTAASPDALGRSWSDCSTAGIGGGAGA